MRKKQSDSAPIEDPVRAALDPSLHAAYDRFMRAWVEAAIEVALIWEAREEQARKEGDPEAA